MYTFAHCNNYVYIHVYVHVYTHMYSCIRLTLMVMKLISPGGARKIAVIMGLCMYV